MVKNMEQFIDESGYCKTDELIAFLTKTNQNLEKARKDMENILQQLGAFDTDEKTDKSSDSGKLLSADEILKMCVLKENCIKLPPIQFNKKSYAEVKKRIENAGGRWQGGKTQGFIFDFDAQRVFSLLQTGESINLQQDYHFFETPDDLADWLVSLSGEWHPTATVLEPSAGRGAIIKAIHRAHPHLVIHCYELMPENKDFLLNMKNVRFMGENFLSSKNAIYSKIIANPPFSNNQDIEHVRKMYECLDSHGVLVAITGANWTFSTTRKAIDFRKWFNEVNGISYEIPAGTFKESGTSIRTMAIVIKK